MARCYGEDRILAPYLSAVDRVAAGLRSTEAPA